MAVPTHPQAVQAQPADAAVLLAWTPPATSNGAITNYTVTPYIAGVAQAPISTGATLLAYQVTGLVNGTAYQFTVYATNASGNSEESDKSVIVTPAAASTGFCSLAELRTYIAQTGTTPLASIDDTYLSLEITAATTAIRTACNRSFELTTAAGNRTFTYRRPSGSRPQDYFGAVDWSVVYPSLYTATEAATLEVDDFFLDAQALSAITVTDYTTAATYTPTRGWPYNAASKGMPFTRLEFASATALPSAPGQLVVNAKWGWTARPDTIKSACLLQASRYYSRRTSPLGVAGMSALGTVVRLQQRLDPDVALMLNDFTRQWAAA